MRYPEAGGSSSFARHAFNEIVSFEAAWAQMLNYIIDDRRLGVLRAALPLGLLGAAAAEPVGHRRRRRRDRRSRRRSTSSASRSRRSSTSSSPVTDFATQVLLVLLGFVLVFSPHILVSNVHLGVAPTWSQFFLAIPIAMLAYTGIETVSNLSEEARDPVRTVPRAMLYVAIAVFAIYFTLPWIALSAMPVFHTAHGYKTCLGSRRPCPARAGTATRTTRCSALVNNLGLGGGITHVAPDLPRHPRLDDPLHRRERRRDRRLADHVRDVRLPAAAARLPPDPPDASRRPGCRSSSSPASIPILLTAHRPDEVPRDDLLVRRDVLVHGRPRLDHPAPDEAAQDEDEVAFKATAQLPVARGQLAALRDRRRPRHGALVARDRDPDADRSATRASAGSCSGSSSTSSTGAGSCTLRSRETIRAPVEFGPAAVLEFRSILVPIAPGYASDEAMDFACRLAAERRASIVAFTAIEVPLDLPLDAELPEDVRRRTSSSTRRARSATRTA